MSEENRKNEQNELAEASEKKNLEPVSGSVEETPERKKGIEGFVDGLPYRSCVLMGICGAYLCYLAYQLISGVIKGAEGSGIVFVFIGAAFAVIGALMLYVAAKGGMRYSNEKKNQQAAEAEENAAKAESAEEEKKEEAPARMSIADRAKLAGRISEDESEAE